ncbi:cell division protein ZapC [Utexia brackfieldae]|uniref:cell division protein ZapC domain-containing protein n=1 Tax=Utexia brackfieldae TaxID=3074108 RepID=UPI00370D45CF
MNIRPAENWFWFFDKALDALMIDLSNEMIFRSRYNQKLLIADALYQSAFCIQDATFYYQFYESCAELSLSEPNRVELVLNALAARNYLKPQLPKSWFFMQQPCFFVPAVGEIVVACTQESGECVNLLTIDVGESASLCVVADVHITMSGKTFYLGEPIKVMHDRLAPKNRVSQQQMQSTDTETNQILQNFLSKVC